MDHPAAAHLRLALLESPVAEIMVYSYAAFHDFLRCPFPSSPITKGRVKNKWMQVCTVINGIYAVGAVAIIGMSIVTRL